MEKIRYGGTIFGLVPGGFDAFSEDKLTIRHQKGDKTLEQIKAIAKTVTASDSIDLLDDAGEVIRSLDGYIYAGDIREIEDYLIEERQIPVSPAKPDEESTVQPENGIESVLSQKGLECQVHSVSPIMVRVRRNVDPFLHRIRESQGTVD